MLIANMPGLNTAFAGFLQALEQRLLAKQWEIETWLRQQWQQTPPLLYSSVDLRNAGFKLAPVDTNLFPAGFNNLNRDFLPLSIQATQSVLAQAYPGCQRILLIPENHTRNSFYFENIATLQEIFVKAGFAVHIGSLLPELAAAKTLTLESGRQLKLEPIQRVDDRLQVGDFYPCIIVLNNDLSAGIPPILQNLKQKIVPPLPLGWSQRLKSTHFHHYGEVSKEFATLIDLDPWLIDPIFTYCETVDFMKREGEACLQENVSQVLQAIKEKYRQYQIDCPPFVTVKADAGTYGMGVMMVQDAAEITQLNRKQRTQMAVSKGQRAVHRVLIQEGVYTFETLENSQAVAEPVVYMIGQHVIGGFYRVNNQRGINENLNSPGAYFEPLAFASCCNNPKLHAAGTAAENRLYAYGVIARLAALAAAREQQSLLAQE